MGVGPSSIQDAWLGVRPEDATEAIVSTHNIVIDWLASYGVIGLCWAAILMHLLWRAGQKLWIYDRSNIHQVISSGLGIAAIMLLVDAQVDLLLFDVGSTLFTFCLLGIAGVVPNGQHVQTGNANRAVALIPLIMMCIIVYFGYIPLANDETLQRNAAISIVAGESTEVIASALVEAGVTRESKVLAAKLFLSIGDAQSAIESIKQVESNSLVWFIRSRAEGNPVDAVVAAKKLVDIDPNGLQSLLLLADALWENGEKDEARSLYCRVERLNEKYEVDPVRMISIEHLQVVRDRCRWIQ